MTEPKKCDICQGKIDDPNHERCILCSDDMYELPEGGQRIIRQLVARIEKLDKRTRNLMGGW